MSQYGVVYRLQWATADVVLSAVTTIPSKTVTVNIFDTSVIIDDADTPQVTLLQAAGKPLTISSVNNSDNKFQQVRSKQAVIRFMSDSPQGQDLNIFADSADNRWYVEIDVSGDMVFKGFLMLSDMTQPFYPDPVVCEVTASDRLGALKGVELVDNTGINPLGKYRIAGFLSFALAQTGLSLPINVINNVKHGTGVFVHNAVFTASSSSFRTGRFNLEITIRPFFYVGQEINITGTASNNGSYIVTDVTVGILGEVVTVSGSIVDEAIVSTTFTDSSSDGHLYDKIYLDAKTFEQEIGTCIDCYTSLQRILGEDCFITQWKGEWWIFRVDEMDTGVNFPARFLADGSFDAYITPIDSLRGIGAVHQIRHADAATDIQFGRPYLFVRETYRYINPLEIVCNINFDRGDEITPPDLAAASSIGTYNLECWTLRRLAAQPITSTTHIAKRYEFGYLKDSYAVITPANTTGTPWDFIESQAIPVQTGDRISVSFDWRYETNFGGGGGTYFPARIYLKGDDGNWYYWWKSGSFDLSQFGWTSSPVEVERYIPDSFDAGDVDESQWRSISIDLTALPVGGDLYIGFNQGHQGNESGDDQNINFQNLNISLSPLINGSYARYDGHTNKVTRNPPTGFSANRDEEVYLGDSPRKTFKGAMFYLDGDGIYRLTSRFWNSAPFALDNGTRWDPFGWIQAQAVWNQYRPGLRTFEATLLGLFSTAPLQWPDLMNKYLMRDSNPSSNERVFMMVSFEQDWKTCRWTGTFIECFNSELGKVYDDTFEFKYITR